MLYTNVIISYSFKWQPACEQEMLASWINYFTVIGWKIPCGMGTPILFPFQPGYVWLAEPWNLSQYCFNFLQNMDDNMLCRLFDDCKYMDRYLPIHQEYGYLGKQSLYFPVSTCEHFWPWPSHLVNCANCSHNPSKFKDVAN